MKSADYIKDKYNDIIARSFNTKLDIFLFNNAIRRENLKGIKSEDFSRFRITKEITENYQKAWQLTGSEAISKGGPTMDQLDSIIENWSENNTTLKELLFKDYKVLFHTEYFPYGSFEKIYDPDPTKRKCRYCKITDAEIKKLRSRGRIFTKANRGYSMEIDRLKPNLEYSKENCVLACYWCNNAKTDEFTSTEFIDYIGPGIESIWKDRNQ